MKTEEVSRAKTHTRYYVETDGKKARVPSVTTIIGILDKPALKKWANRIGLEGIDIDSYVDKLADIGTLAHYLVECDFREETPDLSTWSPEFIDRAENAYISYLNWRKEHEVEPVMVEAQLVSENHRYGGTIDCYAVVDGVYTIVDLKTGKAIYTEMLYQLAAYRQLLTENGHAVENARILRIGRDEDEGFEDRVFSGEQLDRGFHVFTLCRELYEALKEARK